MLADPVRTNGSVVASTTAGPELVAGDHGVFCAVRPCGGQLPWSRRLNARVRASPMTRMVRGTRFGVIASGKDVAARALSSDASR